MLYIGIDLGTSAVKLILTDEKGRVLKSISKEYPISFSHANRAEQNPRDWLDKTLEGLEALSLGINKQEIAGIGFSGQMHGLVILDKNDEIIRPAILWNDGRTGEETEYLNTDIGKERLSEYTGNIAFAGFTAPKLLWLKKHEAQHFYAIRKIMLPKDYLVYMLSGVFSTDYSDAAGTLLLDVKNKSWSREMLKICEIDADMLPPIHQSDELVGTIRPGIAEKLGFPLSVKIFAGAADNAAAAVGTGTVGNASCNISLGTSGTVFISSERFYADPNYALHSFSHADGNYYLMGCMLSAAACHQWWMEKILGSEAFVKEQEAIFPLGENQVYFLPYLMGERSPHNDPYAKGAFLGMNMRTERKDMYQAVLEGVAFGLRDSLEIARSLGISIRSSTISGGGAKSALWQKILANILNLELKLSSTQEGPAFGAAILAAVGCREFANIKEAAEKLIRITHRIEPDQALVQKYEEKYHIFTKLYPALKPLFNGALKE
ncbi:MAG: xylulokinase [Johnsonella sp.]|nr:xylulokinase [Johnsonella sp.]